MDPGALATASPVPRQYLEFKRRHPDAILFFRLGDFFETFDDDARLVSEALDITLTGRDLGRGDRVPMAGIPAHAAESYIARLIALGHRIAICDQVGSAAEARHGAKWALCLAIGWRWRSAAVVHGATRISG